MPYDPTLYRGSARHYLVGRPPYSAELEATMAREAGLDGTGRLLDVGCGPGVLAVRLAGLFEEVIGLDPDPEMLAVAAASAREAGVDHVSWVQACGEDLPAAAPGPFRLVTFGQSLHWMEDEPRVLDAVFELLEPGGVVAMLAPSVDDRPRPAAPADPLIPHEEIRALIDRSLGPARRAGQGTRRVRTHRFEDVVAASRFERSWAAWAPGPADIIRDIDTVISNYLSMSYCAPHLFGDRLDEFIADLRQMLAAMTPTGRFWDWPGDTGIVLARKPAAAAADVS